MWTWSAPRMEPPGRPSCGAWWPGGCVDYVARRTAEGLSRKEIVRCLKRYVAREVFRALVAKTELARAA